MRFQGTIYVNIEGEDRQDADRQFRKIVSVLKNAYSGDLVIYPHGSKVSLV